MQTQTFTLRAADGLELFVYRWLPSGPCKGLVQIAHGLAEHAGRYARLAEALNAAGYAVYANDHRGHGQTCKSKEDLGFFGERDGWRACVNDLWTLNRHIAAQHPGVPLVLLGHSMGATLAEHFIGEHGDALAGVVLCAPSGKPPARAIVGRWIMRLERWRAGPRGHSKVVQGLTFEAFNQQFAPCRTPSDWLSRDTAEVDKYVNDPLCGFPSTIQLWIDLFDGWAALSRPAHLAQIPKNLPVYVIAGALDPVSSKTKQIQPMLAAYKAAGLNVEYRFYPEARHELFNETNRDEVTRNLIEWMNGVTEG